MDDDGPVTSGPETGTAEAPPSVLRAVLVWVGTGALLSFVLTHLAYRLLDVRLGDDALGHIATWAPLVLPLLIAPLTTVPRVRLQRRLAIANAHLADEVRRRAELQAELERLVGSDPLTGARNRRGFFEDAGRTAGLGSVLALLDVDRFKSVNDTLGHAAGDLVLRAVVDAAALETATAGGIVGRLGGDEFVVLLPPGCEDVATRLTDRLRGLAVQLPDGGEVHVTASVGVVTIGPGQTVDDAVAEVDGRMYRAKGTVRRTR